jgi:hypothetical protein
MNETTETWLPLDEMVLRFIQIQYRRLDMDEQLKLQRLEVHKILMVTAEKGNWRLMEKYVLFSGEAVVCWHRVLSRLQS